MKECNRCNKRDCKVMYSKFPTFRHKHKLSAKELGKSCPNHEPLKYFRPRVMKNG